MSRLLKYVLQLMLAVYIVTVDGLKPRPAITFTFNTTTITALLRNMDYLSLHLRNSEDAFHNIVQYLLKHSDIPLHLTMGTDTEELSLFSERQRHRALVIPSSDLSLVSRYTSRSGIFICILLDEPIERILLNFTRRWWIESGIHRVYYISPGQNVFFNPFEKLNERYGVLVDMNTKRLEDIFHNLNGYPLRTYIFDSVFSTVFGNASSKEITNVRGADGKVAKLLSNKLNFTMALQWPDDEFFGARLENGSYDGAIGRMIRYETDITLSGFFVKDYLTRDIEFSVSVYMDELCCYVMKAKRIPQSILPLFAVDVDVWLGFMLWGMFSTLIWIAFRCLNLHFGVQALTATRGSLKTNFQYVRIFIDTWVVWVRVNIVRYPPFLSERVFVVSLCLVSVIFGALFESSLATVFIRPLYYKDINTMQELDDAKFRIYIKHAAMKDDLFYGHSSQVYKNLDRKLLLVGELEERLINMMSKRGGFAAVTRASSLLLDDIRYFITKKIHKIPECPKNYHIAFVFPKKSPFEKRINTLLLQFVEAGLIDQWIDEMKHRAKIHKFPDYMEELGHKWKVLDLKDLQVAFYALTLGCTLAALALAGEFILSLCRKLLRRYKH